MAVNGHYIGDADVSNWPDGLSEAGILLIIKSVEERIEKLTKDFFREKAFDVNVDGNGGNKLNLNLIPNILSISSIDISGVSLSTSYYTHDKHSVFLDTSNITTEAELRYLLKRSERSCLFPQGNRNIHITGTYGWRLRLDIDNVDDDAGSLSIGDVITGGTSEATATVNEINDDYLKISGRSSDNFEDDEEITASSGWKADVDNASGAVNDPPGAIKEACIILARYRNNDTLYTAYIAGSESGGGMSVTSKEKPLTGLREADILIRGYVRKKIRVMVV